MLPAANRLRERADFTSVLRGRGGTRAGSGLVVVHAVLAAQRMGQPPRVGFVVSKAVGNAVVRNRTKRRLRALVAARLRGIPAGVDAVVRAQPAAASATTAELSMALDPLLDKVIRRFEVSA